MSRKWQWTIIHNCLVNLAISYQTHLSTSLRPIYLFKEEECLSLKKCSKKLITGDPIRPIAKQTPRLTEFKISSRVMKKTSMMKMMIQIVETRTTREEESLPNLRSTTLNLSKRSKVGKRNLELTRRWQQPKSKNWGTRFRHNALGRTKSSKWLSSKMRSLASVHNSPSSRKFSMKK